MRSFVLIALTIVTSVAQAATIRLATDPKKSVVDYLSEIEQNIPAENIFASSYTSLKVAGKLTIDLSALGAELREPLKEVLDKKAYVIGDLTVDLNRANLNFVLAREISAPAFEPDTLELLRRQQAASEFCSFNLNIGR